MIISIRKLFCVVFSLFALGCVSSPDVINENLSVSYSQLTAAPGEALIVVYISDEDEEIIKPVSITLNAKNIGKISKLSGLAIRVYPGSYSVSTPFSGTFLIDVDAREGDVVVCELKGHSKGYIIRERSYIDVRNKNFKITNRYLK